MDRLLPRSAWTSVPRPVSKLTPNDSARLEGFAVHWPGSTSGSYAGPTLSQSATRLEAERRLHVSDRGWSDIAYLGAVDLAGRVFDLRGAEYRCAANGDQDVNARYGALTVLACPGDAITPEAVSAVRWWRTNVWLPLYPHATRVVGHRDLHSTDCPGSALYHLVTSGAFLQSPTPVEDDMPTAREVADTLLDTPMVGGEIGSDGHPLTIRWALDRMYRVSMAGSGPVIDYEALAAALAAHGLTVDAAAVADELAKRLQS